mgnify:CR=1 FL=1
MTRAVRVSWEDITAHGGHVWQKVKHIKPKPTRVTTVGWLIYEDDEYIVLAQDLSKDKSASGIATYPKGAVLSMENI